MAKIQWHKADGFTQECFNRWGYQPFNAILTVRARTKEGVCYDATILKHDDGSYIPCKGGSKMPAVKKMSEAKRVLMEWITTATV